MLVVVLSRSASVVNLTLYSKVTHKFTMFSYWLNIATLCIIVNLIAYYFCTWSFNKWEKLNVPYIRPIPLFGNFFNVVSGFEHPVDFYKRIYNELKNHKYGGLFQMRTPYLMIRDPELINDILIKDFSYFTDRGIYSDLLVNPLSDNLFFIENPQWKVIRNKLSPAFTSGKLKLMYDQIKECSDELMKNISMDIMENSKNEIEVRNILGNYSMDVIGTCAYGLKLNTINDKNSDFRKYGRSVMKPSLRFFFKDLCIMITTSISKVIKLKDFPSDAIDFFDSVFRETITNREKNNIVRNDFVQILIQARRDLVFNENLSPNERFKETQIVGNAFAMFVAGFETVSTTLSFCLYELALKKDIQDKVRDEIKSLMLKNNGVIDNDFLINLNYLDMVLAETLRKYPPTFAIFRKASHTYRVPNDSLTIEKGQKILIPTHSLHSDPKYFPEPEVFNPERFSSEEKANRQRGTYFPFGDGPRMCIGKRFAELEMKLALLEILSKFEVEPCEKTEIPLSFGKNTLLLMPENGIWLKFKEISS